MIRYTASRPNIVTGVTSAPIAGKLPRESSPAIRRVDSAVFMKKRGAASAFLAEKLYLILSSAAEAGRICPSNQDLCDQLDLSAANRVTDVMRMLERTNRIHVKRYQSSRQVEIVATGKRTAPPAGAKTIHWRWR